MPTATFYIIQPDSPQETKQGFQAYVLFLLRHFAGQGARLYLNAGSRQEAEQWDELLWQQPAEQFMPHHLVGEGPRNGTQIEVGYSALKPAWNRQIIINLANDETNFAQTSAQVVDFVPCDEKTRQPARERYKIYRQAGFQMQTIAIEQQQ